MRKRLSILAVLLLAVAISAYSVGGTYAKYTSTIEGSSSTARVAKWAFEVNDTAATNSFDFDLFETVVDTVDGNADDEVATGTNENIIAPGTKGQFALKLENLSEVKAEYTVAYNVANTAGIPVEFSIDGTNWTTGLSDVTTAVGINAGAADTITIYWRWPFAASAAVYTARTSDAYDTDLGKAAVTADQEISVQATVTVTQVD